MPTHISRRSLTFIVAGLLLATRFDHFGAVPDASLAVFLLGGMLLGGAGAFAGLFMLAFAVDLAAIEVDAWRAYCMTPAYWGLLPTYALLWLGGAWLGRAPHLQSAQRLLPVALGLFSMAFLLSNLSWWAFSHRFDLSFADFWLAVARYYPPYVAAGMLYVGLFAVAARSVVRPRPVAG
jgi:hypothetical protein